MSSALYISLEVTRAATTDDIKASFKRLALLYHPDKNPLGEEKFKTIKFAYDILSDKSKRHIYDNFGTSYLESPASYSKFEAWLNNQELQRKRKPDADVVNVPGSKTVKRERMAKKKKTEPVPEESEEEISPWWNGINANQVYHMAKQHQREQTWDSIEKIGEWYGVSRFSFLFSRLGDPMANGDATTQFICILCKVLFSNEPARYIASSRMELLTHARKVHCQVFHERP